VTALLIGAIMLYFIYGFFYGVNWVHFFDFKMILCASIGKIDPEFNFKNKALNPL
jgi:hypothetical protein